MSGAEAQRVTAGGAAGSSGAADALPLGEGEWCVGPHEAPDVYELLGAGLRGGEGTTWRARYTGGLVSPLPRAVKVLQRPAGTSAAWPSADDEQVWRDQLALRQHHESDHLVRLFGVFPARAPHLRGQVAKAPDVVVVDMEFVPGPTLDELVRSAPASRAAVAERFAALVGLCRGLAALHSTEASSGNPAVHRDVTPSNCVVHPQRGGVLIDFGTLQLGPGGTDPAGRHTAAYAAPEVLADPFAPQLPSSDAYAAGAVAASCLLGEDPPRDPAEAAERVREACRALRLPPSVAAGVAAALSPDPVDRPVDLVAWAERLHAAVVRRRRPRAAVVGVAGAAAAALVAVAVVVPRGGAADGGAALSRGVVAQGSIDSPPDGSVVPDCSRFTGTATTGAGRTVVLAARNLVNRDPIHYVEPVVGYDRPRTSPQWQGSFWFNEQSVGQSFEVSLVDVDLAALQASLALRDPAADDAVVLRGAVLDSVVLTRGPGADGVTDCLLETAHGSADSG